MPQSTKRHAIWSASTRLFLAGEMLSYPHGSDHSHQERSPMERCYQFPLVSVHHICQHDTISSTELAGSRDANAVGRVPQEDLPQRTTTMIEPVNTPATPAPAIARPTIRAVLLCAVAHTRDLDARELVKVGGLSAAATHPSSKMPMVIRKTALICVVSANVD